MGKINVVREDGSVVAVDEALYNQSRGDDKNSAPHVEAVGESQERHYQDARKAGDQGVIPAFVGSMANTVAFGLPGLFGRAVDNTPAGQHAPGKEFLEDHPHATTAGEIAGLFVPGGQVSVAGRTALNVAERLGFNVLEKQGVRAAEGAAAKLATRSVEGATLGVTSHIAHASTTGDPLTIEGTVESAGIGALLNVALGAVGDRVSSAGAKAKAAKAEADALTTRIEGANKDLKIFKDSPSYTEAYEANKAAVKTGARVTREAEAEAKKYHTFVSSNAKFKKAVGKVEGVINTVERRPGYIPEPATPVEAAPAPADPSNPFDVSDVPVEATPGATPSGGAVSDELKAYRGQVSDIYKKQAGGWRQNGPQRWVKDPSIPADPYGAMEDLRTVQDSLMRRFPKASGKMDDLPVLPRTPTPSPEATLPKSLREFGNMTPEKISRVANDADDITHEAFGKLADELGIARAETPAETVAAIHSRVRSTMDLAEEISTKATAAAAKDGSGLLGWTRKFLRGASSLAFGRAANTMMGGGWKGAVAHVAAYDATRTAVGYAEKALLDDTLVAGKEGIREKVRNVIGKYGERAGAGLEKLGPVTSYLGSTFPDGKPDIEKDPRKQAANRIGDIAKATMTAPDALFIAVEGMMGHPGDVGWKIHNHVTSALNYMLQSMPKDDGLDMKMFSSQWEPSHSETQAIAHTMEAVLNPTDALKRALSGDGHDAATNALWATHSAMMQEFAMELAANMPRDTTYEKASDYSQLLRQPMSPLQEPQIAVVLQGLYLPQPPQQGGAGSSNPTGRPPAVKSQVAGSSVAALTA